MSLLENLFAPGTIERLGWMLVHVLWQATAVAILLAVFLRLLRNASANIRYGAACSALALMVALPLVTMRYLETPGPVAEAGPAFAAAGLPAMPAPTPDAPPADSGHAGKVEYGNEGMMGERPADTPAFHDSMNPLFHSSPVPLRERLVSALEPALPYVVLGWLIGVFGLSAWHLGGWTQLQRLKRRMVREIGTPLQRKLEELGARLGLHRAVGLLESALVEVPTVVGWLRPVILLPASALTGLRPEQLEAILAHELAHIRRYDYLVNMLQTVVEILGFYHPAIWWVSHRIRIERENCCDDLAVQVCGNSLQYARALACMEEIRHGRIDLAVAATGGSLMARIARLLGRPAVEDRRFAWLPGLIALLLVASIVIPGALVVATAQQSQPAATALADTPDWAKASLAALPGWEMEHLDAAPSVTVGGRNGLRLIVKRSQKEYLDLDQRQRGEQLRDAKFVIRHQHVEIVVFPGGELPLHSAIRIGWTQWEDELPYFNKVVHLGQGMGMNWYAKATIYDQERLRQALDLQGGDDRLALLTEALLVRDQGMMTRNSCVHLLAAAGDGAIPYIKSAVEGQADGPQAVYALAFIQTDAATQYLQTLYQAESTRVFAEYALIHEPFRPAAKEQYLDMLQRRRYVSETAKACVQFSWKEAIPLLDARYRQAHSLGEFEAAFRAKRTLEGRPVPAEIDQAQKQLQHWVYSEEPPTREDLAATKETLLRSSDTEAAIVVAIRVSMLGFKASHERMSPIQEVGREVLRELPQKETAGIIQRLAESLEQDPSTGRTVKTLREILPSESDKPSRRVGEGPTVPFGSPSKEPPSLPVLSTTRPAATSADTGGTNAFPNADAAQVLLEFRIAKVAADLHPDRVLLQQMAQALGDQSPLARALRQPGRELDMTLDEVFKRYIVPQSLSEQGFEAMMHLLPSHSGTTILASPRVLAHDGEQVQMRAVDCASLPAPSDSSSGPPTVECGTAITLTGHVLDRERVTLEMMAEISNIVSRDSNEMVISRSSAETSATAWHDRYLVWAAVEPTAIGSGANRQSVYIMVKPHISLPSQGPVDAARPQKPTEAHPRQVRLDVRMVTMERGALLNLNVEWGWPTVKSGEFPPPAAGGAASPGRGNEWPYGVQIGYTPDRQFTDSLLMALDLLQEKGQAHVSGQQILAQDGRQCRIKALTEEWYTVTAPATKQSPQPHTEAHKTESGTVVTITPHLGDNGEITMTTAIEVSTSLPKARGSDLPLLTRRTAKNAVTIRDGGTVAVAGLVENRAGPNDKSVRETAIFVTAHLIQDVNEAALPAPQSAEPSTQAPQSATGRNGKEGTVTATSTNTDLLNVLAETSRRTGVQITPDATVKTMPVTAEFAKGPLETALLQILKNTPYTFQKLDDHTYLVFRPLSFTFPKVELIQALQDLATAAAVPIIPDPNVTGQVNVTFQDVSLDQALQMLLAGKPYVFKRMPRYYLVAYNRSRYIFPADSETRRIHLHYTQPSRAKQLLSPIFAPYVQAEPFRARDPNDEGNTLIVAASPALLDRILEDIKRVDRPKRQVLLDARVVMIEPNELQNLGVEWAWPTIRSITLSPSTPPETKPPSIGYVPDRTSTESLMMTLNQLCENGRADIIANPKVAAQDGRQAQMKVIQEQWFMMTVPENDHDSPGRPELQKLESGTLLTMTPSIGDRDDITLRVAAEISDSTAQTRSNGLPPTPRSTEKWTVTLHDGGTVAVARLVGTPSKPGSSRPPVLADIPLLGELFKNRSNDKASRELVVFVTAHLVPDTGTRTAQAPESGKTAILDAEHRRTREKREAADAVARPADSRAWYVMRQLNGPPLLLGLTQQLLKALPPARQNDAMWQEVADGGSLKLDVKVERETGREIVVGLFQDAKWSQEPVAVRLLPKEGTYTLTGLPAGQYQIGAMIGRSASAAALGVQRTWPEAIEIKPGRTTEAQLLVSRKFALNASGWYNREVSRDYTGDWSLLKEDRLLQGRLTGPDGAPIPFGRVSVREYQAVPTSSIAAPELGTNEAGVYRFDKMK